MPPRFVRQAVANNTAQSLVLSVKLGAYLGVRLANAHSEYAHSVYKYAPNKFSFRANIISIFPCHPELVEGSSVAKNQTIAPDKFFISARLYKG